MTSVCPHEDLMVHVFIELQVPYYLLRGEIDDKDIDDTPVIRPDMGATCQQCQEFDVHYEDWRRAPAWLRTLFSKVRRDLEAVGGYIEAYPPGEVSSDLKRDPGEV